MKKCAYCGEEYPDRAASCSIHGQSLITIIPPLQPKYLDITWDRVLTIWWALVWCSTVFGMALGASLGFTGGFLVGFAVHPELGGVVGILLGWLGGIPLSIVILRLVLRKKFGDFSIRLIENP